MEFEADYKMISDLMPRYDGNPKRLNFYIREVDGLISFTRPRGEAGAQAIVCLIKSRLSGAAIDAIAYEGSVNSWDEIKAALRRRLGEPRNEIQVMQELTRTRRNKSEDAETYGKRIRELLDTLYLVGQHTDKTYYEKMAIEHYVQQLDFHVSVGVRIANPNTLELAIVTARQEEAKANYRQNPNFNSPSGSQNKPRPEIFRHQNNNNFPRAIDNKPFNSPISFIPQSNFVPQRNNWTPEQRQQFVNSVLPWKNRPPQNTFRNSGHFRNNNFQRQPNIPNQQVNPPLNVSDVTMRSVNKPTPPQFAVQELFYNDGNVNPQLYEPPPADYSPSLDAHAMYYPSADEDEQQVSAPQDFCQDQYPDDQS